MVLKHRAAIGGMQLDSVDNRILVLGVASQAAKESEVTENRGGDGSRFVRVKRDSIEITVKVGIKAKRDDMAGREELMEEIVGWANNVPAWLTTDQKPDRRIWVESVRLPAAGDPWEWTNEFTLTFKACGVPYWQQIEPGIVSVRNVSNWGQYFGVPGNTNSVMNASFQNTSGSSCSSVKITAGSSIIQLTDVGLANGETLVIDHREDGLLRIRIRNSGGTYRSVLNKRTASSANDLNVKPGSQLIGLNADKSGTVTFSCYGRFA